MSTPGELARHFEAAWNSHDMEGFSRLFHEDATFVNRIGQYWRGRDEIIRQHALIHTSIYQDTTISNRVQDVDFIGEAVAIVHVRSTASFGPSMPHGPREASTQLLYVATLRDGEWRIQAGHNVALMDPKTGRLFVER